jgi:GntR family transcriptional regulator, transcriptional repressor for pyruvate dehydrogenase complex
MHMTAGASGLSRRAVGGSRTRSGKRGQAATSKAALGERLEALALESLAKPGRLSERVYETILTAIMDGSLALGSRLPPEAALAERFGVSRHLVREALARLRDDDLVYSRQGSGSFVRARPDRAVLRFAPLDSLAAIHRVYEFRQSIEGDAAYWAAVRTSRKAFAPVSKALAVMEKAILSDQVGAAADFQLHAAIARASANPFYLSALTSLRGQIMFGMALGRNLALARQGEHREMARRQHRAICEAISSGQAERARAEMRRHLDMSRRTLFEGSDPA